MAVNPRGRLVVVATLLLVGCTASQPSAETPLATTQPRPTSSGPTASLPLARQASPSPSPTDSQAVTTASQTLQLQSSAFASGGTIPADFTCDGANVSPPLSWTGAPPGTAAFTLVEQDMDAAKTNDPATQWLIYNMPSRVNALSAGVPTKPMLTNGAQQGLNDHQTIGYVGPCPNHGDPAHHYSFQLLAQDAYVTLETGARIDGVRQALTGHTLGEAQLVATFRR